MEDFAEVRIERREEGGISIFIKSKKIEDLVKSGLTPMAKAALASSTSEKYTVQSSVPNPSSTLPFVKGDRNTSVNIWRGYDIYNSQAMPTTNVSKGLTDWVYAKYFISNSGVINLGMFLVKGLSEGVTFVETSLIPNQVLELVRDNFKEILVNLYKQHLKNPKIQLKLTMEELI